MTAVKGAVTHRLRTIVVIYRKSGLYKGIPLTVNIHIPFQSEATEFLIFFQSPLAVEHISKSHDQETSQCSQFHRRPGYCDLGEKHWHGGQLHLDKYALQNSKPKAKQIWEILFLLYLQVKNNLKGFVKTLAKADFILLPQTFMAYS